MSYSNLSAGLFLMRADKIKMQRNQISSSTSSYYQDYSGKPLDLSAGCSFWWLSVLVYMILYAAGTHLILRKVYSVRLHTVHVYDNKLHVQQHDAHLHGQKLSIISASLKSHLFCRQRFIHWHRSRHSLFFLGSFSLRNHILARRFFVFFCLNSFEIGSVKSFDP